MNPTYTDPLTKKPVDLSGFGDAGAQNLQANKMGYDIAPSNVSATIPVMPNLPPPTPATEGVTKADIPTTGIPSMFQADVAPFVKQQQDFITQQKTQQQAFLQAQTPTAQEEALTKQMNDLNASARQAMFEAETRSGGTAAFAGGESARISRQATIQIQGVTDQLNALVAKRGVQVDALKTQMEFNKANFDALTNLSKLTKPEVLKTEIDSQTGDVMSIVQDPQTGKVTMENIGNIGVDAKNQYSHQGTYQNDATGQAYFYGVTASGKIETIALPGSAGLKPTAGGSTTTPGAQVVDPSTGQILEYGTPEYVTQRLLSTASSKVEPVAAERLQLSKFTNVIGQTSNLIGSLKGNETGPITGFLKGLNPYNFDARTVNAQLQALVPGVARGVYGEVGVLTNQDIQNYIQTLPNLKSTKEQNKFVALLTLQNARRSYESTLVNLANSNVNVSGFADSYKDIVDSVSDIEKELGIKKGTQSLQSIGVTKDDESLFDDTIGTSPSETKGGFWSDLWKGIGITK